MKKKWLSWLLITIAALIVVGGILWVRYGNKLLYKHVFVDAVKHVSFAYPDQRALQTGAANPFLIATVTSPEISEFTPSFNVTKEDIPSDMSLDFYLGQTMKQLGETIVDFKRGESSTLNINGQPARKVLFSGKYLDQSFSWEQVYTIKDNAIYVLTYVAPVDKFSGSRDAIETSFSTFAFQ